ncbi:hypothetical protein T552_00945 [Pneumocystis carinii B80]|uniref:Uncharacterized protein n=1 Tax=Pneumocystis carinii (strain B80) TaxID=1408658 RepID=A0A0W4ZMY4_PNEC8|nr:hypothetical protein T552_00945 [Pneumocystis carinii B80]KTW29738.1 hypothetical protein T552_00945 [Pneumocystis carinii B80]
MPYLFSDNAYLKMSMNKWESDFLLTIKAQRMIFKYYSLSILSVSCLFIPFTIIFSQKFKFLSYFYLLIKKWGNILEAYSDLSNNSLKEGSNIYYYLKMGPFSNYLDIIQKTFKTESKLCMIEQKTKNQKTKILTRNTDFQYLESNNFLSRYFSCFIKKGHLIQHSNIKESNLYPFYQTNSLIHKLFESYAFKRDELIPRIRFDSILKLKIHDTFKNSRQIDLFNKEIGELNKIQGFSQDRKKDSQEDCSKIEFFSKNNQKRFIETLESILTDQLASKFFYKKINSSISDSKSDVFRFQFISYLSEDLIYISPIILEYDSIQELDTGSDYKQKLYISLCSEKKNNYWPLSDIQNCFLKNTTRLLCDSSSHTKKTSFKGKTFEKHNTLKENMSPNSIQNNIESSKRKNYKKISDISNSHQNYPIHFIHLNHEIDTFFSDKYHDHNHNHDLLIHKNISSETDKLSGSKLNLIKSNNTDLSSNQIKYPTYNTIHTDNNTNYSKITISLNSPIPSPISKYKNFKNRKSSTLKINDIYSDSLCLLKEVYYDNRRRGIPPTPPPTRKRWELVNN